MGWEDPDPSFLHHVKKTRKHANTFIVAKLMKQVRNPSEKMTNPLIKNCELEMEKMG